MFDVRFYTFSKNENSTKRPDAETAVTYSGSLKENCGILNPSITFRFENEDNPPTLYNYAFIPVFGRYYWISEWKTSNHLWECNMKSDSLATFKTQISNSEQYVLRSRSNYDGKILDSVYPTICIPTISRSIPEFPWATSLGAGRYIVGIINGDSQGVGAVSYYSFNTTSFNSLKSQLFNTTGWVHPGEWDDISEDLFKSLFNPFQYIVSCKWFPFIPATSGTVSTVPLGWWNLSITGTVQRIDSTGLNAQTIEFDIPKHHKSSSRGQYLNNSPYSNYRLIFNPICEIEIDSNLINGASTLRTTLLTDLFTGDATLALDTGSTNQIFMQINGSIGVDIQLAQTTTDHLGVASGVISASESLSQAWNPFRWGSVATGAASGIESATKSSIPQLQTSGGNGKLSDYYFSPALVGTFYDIVDENIESAGRPLCKRVTINTLEGYILVSNADISIPGTSTENEIIKSYMEGGFYYE